MPGMIVQAVTTRGTGQLNGWVDVPMSPGGVEEIMIVFETFDNFPLGDSVLLTVEVEGGQVTNQDTIQALSTDLRVTVDQKRSVEAVWNLDSSELFSPEDMNTFQINVTTDSTMAVTVNLTSSVPESVFLDCRPRSQDGGVVLFMPGSSPGPAQTATIECDFSLQADERERTVNFVLTDEMGDTIWSSGQVHLKTEQIEESGGFAGFGSLTLLMAGIAGGIVFVAFFIYMIALIYRRRRTLDEIEDMDEEDVATYGSVPESTVSVVAEQPVAQMPVQPTVAAPGPMPSATSVVQPVTPAPEPSPADYTDDQLRASGWSDVQINELRGVPDTSVDDAFNSLEVVTEQSELSSSSLPAFNCIVTGNVLTSTDAWWQCAGCGGFAAATAIAVYTHCPACNMAR